MDNVYLLHFTAELTAFILEVALLAKFVWPVLARMLEQRQQDLDRQITESEDAARELQIARRWFDDVVFAASKEEARILADADAAHIHERLREQAEREVQQIKRRAEEELAAWRAQTMRELLAEICAVSFELARQKVLHALTDEASRRRTVDRFLDELARMPAASVKGNPGPPGGGRQVDAQLGSSSAEAHRAR